MIKNKALLTKVISKTCLKNIKNGLKTFRVSNRFSFYKTSMNNFQKPLKLFFKTGFENF